MANYLLCLGIFRIALPIFMSVCVVFRPSLLSAIYLLLLFYLPFVPVPTSQSMKGHTGIYLKILIGISSLTFLSQVVFQVTLLALPPYANFLKDCEFLEKILRHVGYVKLNQASVTAILTWLSPEILMLLISIVTFFVLRKLSTKPELEPSSEEEGSENPQKKATKRKKYVGAFVAFGRYGVLVALCLAAVLRPSVIGGLYFLVFLCAATWWSCYRQLRKGFAIVLRCLLPVVFLHLSCLYAYQFQWPQEFLESNSTYARYFGLTPLLTMSCDDEKDPRELKWAVEEWASYVNPIAIYLLFYIIVLESKALLEPEAKAKESSEPGETTPLIRGVSPSSRRYGSGSRKSGVLQDSTGSVTVTGENNEEIPMDQLEEEYKPTIFEHIIFAVESILQVIIRSSYIATNIIMMAWSITYLSWITFVLLIWANLLWLVPNQRKSMLRSSPFLVIYAWFLLISAYIYSMNLTEEELPSKIQGFNLAQIGFIKVTVLPCNQLLVKCLYTVMFWITLRQYMHERITARQSSALADMVAPLQVTVGTATGVNNEQEKNNKMMDKIGQYIKRFLTKFWIWVVAATLFGVAITGQSMTVFRIIYMGLFLFFILSFQLSFGLWRKMMFGFWLTVIVYSMVILVLVYTYQFDNFSYYWSEYLHVPQEQQEDIGLEKFQITQLFVRLVTPTFFVIITVIQLHYFHKEFMELSDPKNTLPVNEELDESSMQGGALADKSENEDLTSSSVKFDLTEIANISSRQFQNICKLWLKRLHHAMNLIFLFLELHMPKVVLFFAMLVCVYDKCALYLIIVVLISLSFTFGRPLQTIAIYVTSVLVSVLLLARMIYQIKYIDPSNWDVNCTRPDGNSTKEVVENNAKWLGFEKAESLPVLVRWNISYIIVVTLWSVIQVRQYNYRISRGKPVTKAFFVFPKITRAEADKNLRNCLKYLVNFSFYKFGVEFSLMATVATIGFRMDLFGVIYSIWLCILFSLSRSALSRIWNVYLIFIAICLPLQYVLAVGIPPSLCINFPWDSSVWLRKLQEWSYLPDYDYPPSTKKLLCDFVLLLFVSRQSVVFRIEKRYAGKNYAGGSNESIIHHADEKDFENPVPDFITYVRTYLDIFKRGILPSFLWVTLAIVFLAGTNRVNLFSIGYLLGAFIFLWEGSDLYLRPIPKILKAWNWLLGYNVTVILLKALTQIVGCVFIQDIPGSSCWTIQLLGIGCVRKFGNVVEAASLKKEDECEVPREFIGLVWDGLCFGFLLMQKRIFQSYNFFHMVDETKAATILASRGADLIEELRLKRMIEQEDLEKRILQKIKMKMDKIKANQKKIQGASYEETDNHFVAIRSGDYYMFDDLEDDDIDLLMEEGTKDEEEEQAEAKTKMKKRVSTQERSVTIADDPQPGTSKDEDISDLSELREETWLQKIVNYLLLVWTFIESGMLSLTHFLNQYSRDYRYVIKVLTKEKKILKEKTNYNVGMRVGSSQVWQPAGSYHSLLKTSRYGSEMHAHIDEYETEMSSYDQPTIVRLLLAIWYIIMSRSELLCYFIVFLNQMKSATFLSLPLPLMVFLWGTLTVPRPSKTFWVTIIAYTEIIVLVKCMFQFEIIPWNQNQSIVNNPFYPPRIIGIERTKNYAVWDLLLLLVVFFHRFMLKSMGLWKTTTPIPAAMLSQGDFKLVDGQLVPVDNSSPKSKHSKRSTPTRRSSDSQHLIEKDSEDDQIPNGEDANKEVVSIHSEVVDTYDHFPSILRVASAKYAQAMQKFFRQLLDPSSRVATDVYSYMFLCDFFNFFVILIGYSSFGNQQGDGGVSSYLQDNRVPALFLVMLILQFMLIIIDRGIFLRKNILGKIIFQFIQIFLLHIWLFILFPIMTGGTVLNVLPPQMYYMVKCFYLLLSAYQIRSGYPTRILGNFLCKGYNYANMFLFKGFMVIPFLFELRTVMDWMWTDTSMTVFDWIKMEDIFAHIFQLKCTRHVEDKYPQPRGERKKPVIKYLMGGALLAIIIGIIWFPLVFFSLGNAVGESNIPYDVTLEVRIGPYEPVYQMSAQSNSIYTFSENDVQKMIQHYSQMKSAITFISNYEPPDIAAVKLSTDSANIWSISPPDRRRMFNEVNSTKPLTIRLQYKVSHKTSKPEDSGVISESVEIVIGANTTARNDLLLMLDGKDADAIVLQYLLPKFLKVTNRGTAKPIDQLMEPFPDIKANSYRNVSLTLLRQKDNNTDGGGYSKEWWQLQEECDDYNYEKYLSGIPFTDCGSIILYTFNDKIFPSTLNIITSGGIVGLYMVYTMVVYRLFRRLMEPTKNIWLEEMPNVNRVYALVQNIYFVRACQEYDLEEVLYAKLIFLMRSSELRIKFSRKKGDPYNPAIIAP